METSGRLVRRGWRMICQLAAATLVYGALTSTSNLVAAERDVSESRHGHVTARSQHRVFRGVDLDGRVWHLGQRSDSKAIAVAMLSTECPISNAYLPLLNKLARRFKRQGVEFYGVISDPSATRAAARDHRRSYAIAFPVLFDGSGELRRLLGATHTPHVFLLNVAGITLYQGAIDNQFADLGQKRDAATRRYLENAILAALDGNTIAVTETQPVGCLLEDASEEHGDAEVTYSRHIAPIVQTHCVMCHRPEETGPFPLLTYHDVSRHARQIVEVTKSRFMPPWKPVVGFGQFRDQQRLSDQEIELISRWVRGGKPRGNAKDLPPRPVFPRGWRLGRPDVVLTMKQSFELPASGPDIHQHFVIPTRMVEDRLVAAVEFQPGNPRVVHHASFYVDTKGLARKLDDLDPDYGYGGSGGPGFVTAGSLRSWLPGMRPRRLPPGMGRLIQRGADLVIELHYRCSGKVERDRSKVGLYYAPRAARQAVIELQVVDKRLVIPAGAKRHHHRGSYVLPVDTILLDVAPHMHFLGHEMKAVATRPDGTTEPLVHVDDWDFNWQGQFVFLRPIRLPKGTRIDVDAWYDNSVDNPMNPNSPPKTTFWGEQSSDEMNNCHFQCTCDTWSELLTLASDTRRYYEDQRHLHRATLRKAGRGPEENAPREIR